MNGLRTARVVVIDDEARAAMPVITAMGRLGIGCIHVPGDKVEELPQPPFSGVRLAFVDMFLGTSGDARQIGAHTANVFSRVIGPGTGPILLLLWTKHPEYVQEFKRALFEQNGAYRAGLLIAAMDKPENLEEIRSEEVVRQVEEHVKRHFPVEAVWLWEQLSHDAVSDTTAAITEAVTRRASVQAGDSDEQAIVKWLDALSHVFRSLIQATAGKNAHERTAFEDLLQALIQMHQDRLEHQYLAADRFDLARVFTPNWGRPSEEERTVLNTMLLVAPVRADDSTVRPGNVYVPDPGAGQGCPHARCGIDRQLLAEEVLRPTQDEDYRRLSQTLEKLEHRDRKDPTKIADAAAELRQRLDAILNDCPPILLEVTASCDYDQHNCRVLRFLAGLLVPAHMVKLIEVNRKSNRQTEAIRLSMPSRVGAYHLVVSSRLLFSIPNQPELITTVPIARLRGPVLQDIQSWSSSHGSRPGYVKLESA